MSAIFDITKFTNLDNWSVAHLLENQFQYNKNYQLEKIGSFLIRNKTKISIDDSTQYRRVKIKLYNKGVLLRDKVMGRDIGTKKQFIIKKGQFLLSKIDARNGAFGLATEEVDGAIITADFFAYDIDTTKVEPYFLVLLTTTKKFQQFAQSASSGTTGRQRIDEKKFLDVKIPLPPLDIQRTIVQNCQNKSDLAILQKKQAEDKEREIEEYLYKELGVQVLDKEKIPLLNFISFGKLNSWSYRDTIGDFQLLSSKYEIKKLNQNNYLYENIFRGKSPKYDETSKSKILNQKCIRWNYLEIEHSKKVNTVWLDGIDKKFFTKENDILINSTGDGTIGRATYITKQFKELLYDSHILLIRVEEEEINALYLTYFLNSTLGQKQIENIKSAIATKQTELGLNNFKNIQFILPPIKIQNAMSIHLDNLKNEIENLKEQSIKNKKLALIEFEKEIFHEA